MIFGRPLPFGRPLQSSQPRCLWNFLIHMAVIRPMARPRLTSILTSDVVSMTPWKCCPLVQQLVWHGQEEMGMKLGTTGRKGWGRSTVRKFLGRPAWAGLMPPRWPHLPLLLLGLCFSSHTGHPASHFLASSHACPPTFFSISVGPAHLGEARYLPHV